MNPFLLLPFLVQSPVEWAEFAKLAGHRDPGQRIRAIQWAREHTGPETERALLALLGDPHPRVRYRATLAFTRTKDPEPLVRAGLRHPSPLGRRSTCEALGAMGARAAVPDLIKRLRDSNPDVRGEAARALGLIGDPSAAEALAAAFERDRCWPLRAFGLEATARLDPTLARTLLEAATSDGHFAVRIVAAETWPRVDPEGAIEGLAGLVDDRDWRVRVAVIEACLQLRRPACVGWLIRRLGEEKGRLRWDALTALMNLTGKDLGLEAEPWKRWWEVNRETFKILPPTEASRAPSTGATHASFFDIPILSRRIVFLLDLSGSMRDPAPGPNRGRREGGTTKLDVAKKGMIETLRRLPKEARFGIAGLGCDGDGNYTRRDRITWGGRLVLRPAAGRAHAERFVNGLEAKGWTNLFDALAYAFETPEVDTVYLYSDGGASKGAFVAAGEILEHLGRLNRFRKIVVHAVEVPGERNPEANRRLLRRLAEASGGTCKLHP